MTRGSGLGISVILLVQCASVLSISATIIRKRVLGIQLKSATTEV